jgi:zinc protease
MKRLFLLASLVGCAAGPVPVAARGATCRVPAPQGSVPVAVVDALGVKPEVVTGPAFAPPAPVSLRVGDVPVHVLARHALPLVALNIVIRGGAATDPANKPGLTHVLTKMLLEGAGARSGAELAAAFDALGADYGVSAYTDYATLSLVVTKDRLAAALDLLRDVLQKPKLAQVDFERAKGLWIDELKNQERDPKAIAERVSVQQLYGALHPYGHLRTGDAALSKNITLADVKSAYAQLFAPGAIEVVVVGDVEPQAVLPQVQSVLAGVPWGKPRTPATIALAAYTPPFGKIVLVDRPDAPQAVVSLVTRGVRAEDRTWAALPRANAILGGSFTSRLNQDIREERGLAYGASSRLSFAREGGMFVAGASLFAQKAREGTKALVEDVYAFAGQGPTEEESAKSRLLARSELVETYETVTQTAARFARNIGAGLPVAVDAELAPLRDQATRADLTTLAQRLLPKGQAFLVYIGPKAEAEKVLPELAPYGFTGIIDVGVATAKGTK